VSRRAPIALFLLPMILGQAIAQQVMSPGQVLAHIRSVGSKQALVDYFQASTWDVLMRGIRSGDDGWLNVYAALRPAADGETGEDLEEAVFDAIPRRPFRVLPFLVQAHKQTVQQLCTFTFESQMPEGGVNNYLSQLDRSLKLAVTKEQRQMAVECHLGIEVSRKQFGGVEVN
jgi:hypothetical protein